MEHYSTLSKLVTNWLEQMLNEHTSAHHYSKGVQPHCFEDALLDDFRYEMNTWLGKTGPQRANKPPNQGLVIAVLVIVVVSTLTIMELNRSRSSNTDSSSQSR